MTGRATVFFGLLLLWPAIARPASPNDVDPATMQKILQYIQDPQQNRRAILRLAANGNEDLPVPVLLVLADAQLRNNRSGSAQRLYEQVLEEEPAVSGMAEMGLGWAALAHGDLETAREHYQQALNAGGDQTLATAMMGLIDAANGNPAAAIPPIDQLLADRNTPGAMIDTLRLLSGYTRYWAGDLSGAAAAFNDVIAANPDAPAADDARYGTALTLSRRGDPQGAAEMLSQMKNVRRVPSGRLVELDARTVLRAAFRRFRKRTDPAPPNVGGLLSGDGPALARASARRVHRRPAAATTPVEREPAPGATTVGGTSTGSRPAPATAPEPARHAPSTAGHGWLWAAALGVVALVLAIAVRRGRAA